jgi:hypothetical protein
MLQTQVMAPVSCDHICRILLRLLFSKQSWQDNEWFTPGHRLARQAVQRIQPPMHRSSRMLLGNFSDGTDLSEMQPGFSTSGGCMEGFRVQWCVFTLLLHVLHKEV